MLICDGLESSCVFSYCASVSISRIIYDVHARLLGKIGAEMQFLLLLGFAACKNTVVGFGMG